MVRWRGDVEGADQFQRVAEEIEPQRLVRARHEQVEDAAAHREFADVAHGRHALEAGFLQPRDQRLHVDLVAGPRRKVCASTISAGGMRCSSALAVVSTTARCGFFASAMHRRQRIEPPGGGVGAGRDAVIGQAVPGRQFDHRQFGRGEGQRLHDRRQALAVARHEHTGPSGASSARPHQRKRLVAVGDAVDDELAGAAFRQADGGE